MTVVLYVYYYPSYACRYNKSIETRASEVDLPVILQNGHNIMKCIENWGL